ncbi:MAG TPA: hypothetical protein VNO19_05820 [Gemmatimonadales bacterium]|nr:hypothetical protein [Gemmatimonadales bacterium]
MRPISAAGLLAFLGCGTDPDAFSRCAENITVTVSHEVNPVFAWTPAECTMSVLDVSEDQQTRWYVSTVDGANRITSPLRYGQTVPEATQGDPLFSGFFYTVHLWRTDGEGIARRLISHRFLHQVE